MEDKEMRALIREAYREALLRALARSIGTDEPLFLPPYVSGTFKMSHLRRERYLVSQIPDMFPDLFGHKDWSLPNRLAHEARKLASAPSALTILLAAIGERIADKSDYDQREPIAAVVAAISSEVGFDLGRAVFLQSKMRTAAAAIRVYVAAQDHSEWSGCDSDHKRIAAMAVCYSALMVAPPLGRG